MFKDYIPVFVFILLYFIGMICVGVYQNSRLHLRIPQGHEYCLPYKSTPVRDLPAECLRFYQ